MATVKIPLYCPHQPTYKQLLFLSLKTEEAFYGGAGGGGKSDALLMAALQYVDVPNYHAIIFRKTFADLSQPEALMSRASDWLNKSARWDDREKTWHFPTHAEDATLTFGYLEHDVDKYRYQGTSYQYIGWDELTQFPEQHYRYLFGWLRKVSTIDVPLRVRAASNPGGIGHDWVKQRFIVEGQEKQRPFIPAKMTDNPFLDVESYKQSLRNLDPITRSQIEKGDWSARQAGGKFRREWFGTPVEAVPADLSYVRYWDMAATEKNSKNDPDWTAGCLLGKTEQNIYYIKDMRHIRGTPLQVENLIRQTAQVDGKEVTIYMEQEPGASGKNTIDYYTRSVLSGWTFYPDKTSASKIDRANPVSSQAQAGNIKLVHGNWINDFLDEADSFPEGSHDDQIDALSGAFTQLSTLANYGFGFV